MGMSDKDMIEALKAGDDLAFRTLVETHKLLVVNTCYGFTHNREDAEDLAQEVFLQAYESIHRFRSESSLSTWLYRIAVNKSLNSLRSLHKRVIKVGLDDLKPAENNGNQDEPVENRMIREENLNRLHAAVDSLPPKQRTAFVLNKYEELPYREVATIMGLSIAAIESLIFRAKNTLEKNLKSQDL